MLLLRRAKLQIDIESIKTMSNIALKLSLLKSQIIKYFKL